jgi:prolipoprotein diacylglyceryltransferase
MEFFAYWGVFLSNIRVASAAHKASEVDCLLFFFVFLVLCFSFYLFLWVVLSGVLGGRSFSTIFGWKTLRAASHDSLTSEFKKGGLISCFVRSSYDNVLISA